jgi:hypothetical protein
MLYTTFAVQIWALRAPANCRIDQALLSANDLGCGGNRSRSGGAGT